MAEKGKATTQIDAPPSKILAVVADVEDMPRRLSAFHRAQVLERDSEGRPLKAEFELDARLKVLEYTLAYTWSDSKVEWKSVAGDVKDISGSYTLEESGGSTKVTYEYSIDPGFAVPGFMMRQGVKVMVSTALNDLKKTAEA